MEMLSRHHLDGLDYTGSRWITLRLCLTPLAVADEPELVRIMEHALMNLDDDGPALLSTRQRLDHFFASYQEPGCRYQVLREGLDGRILGGVGLRPFAGLAPEERLGEIRELVIDSYYRGLGLGRKVLDASIQMAFRMGYRRLYLQITSQMLHARHLFERSGFRPLADTLPSSSSNHPSYFVLGEEPPF